MSENKPSHQPPLEKSIDYHLLLHFYSQYDSLGHFLYDTRERRYATCKEYLNRLSDVAEMSNYEVSPTMVRRALYIYYSCLTGHLLDPVRASKLASCVDSLETKDHIFKCKDEILQNKVFVETKVLDQVWQIENRKYNLEEKIPKCDAKCSEWFYKLGLCNRFLKARRIKKETDVAFSEAAEQEIEEGKKYYAVCDDFKKKAVSCVGEIFCENQEKELKECLSKSSFMHGCEDEEKALKKCSHYNYALMNHLKFRKNNIRKPSSVGTAANEDQDEPNVIDE
ncbi:hypothetical protein C9374_007906 [Naegleria lovaniensis]|uniref:Uncharacterized protein n=1 Tax=Naegleria lovaniensis TaxID=51637 RepID=A0AA88GM58_NAELO|nr:uncharacterized protein C9374_007906 [Naegleria lovaniensis]KAG2378758.1 hypothetical protein C9374_007906 [Naegleria lovaniensis]